MDGPAGAGHDPAGPAGPGSPTRTDAPGTGGPRRSYAEVQASPEFQELRRRLRAFVFPATVVFLAWYLLYVLMSAYARDFMAQPLLGNINVGYVFGLLQFVSTFAIAYLYYRYATSKVDPIADQIYDELEGPR